MKKITAFFVAAFIMAASFSVQATESVFDDIVLYIPNRIVDVMDIFSLELGFGPTIKGKLFATRPLSVGAGINANAKVIKQYNRQYGAGLDSGWDTSFIMMSAERRDLTNTTLTVDDYYQFSTGIPTTDEKIYDFYEGERDYWSLGVQVGVALVEFDFELHPVEIADLVTGFLFLDLKGDDFGSDKIRK